MRWRLLTLVSTLALAAGTATAEPVRLSADVFGTRAEIEIRGPAARRGSCCCQRSVARDPRGKPVGRSVKHHADGSRSAQRRGRRRAPTARGSNNGAAASRHAILSLDQRRPWPRSGESSIGCGSYPACRSPTDLRDAVISANCNHLRFASAETGVTVQIAAGSRVAALGMEQGFCARPRGRSAQVRWRDQRLARGR